ncbi:thioredoxin, partial [Oesophagostomum dentatum]
MLEVNWADKSCGLYGTESPTAVLFVQSKDALNEKKDYKKLPAALPDVKILFADCSKIRSTCQNMLDMQKLPQFVTFKTTGGYEIDYANKKSYYDVRAFIKESITSPLHVLSEEAYNNAVKSGQLWIIDYFAPWCPPCLRLIGEYRRLHSIIDRRDEILPKLKIGLIDCQKFNHICQRAGVQSYPTSALYTPDGRVQQFVGYHAAATVLELID